MNKLHKLMDDEDSKLGTFILFFYYRRYKYWQMFIHRFNYHHMELSHPDGETLAWCQWCGLRDRIYDTKAAAASLRDAARASAKLKSELATSNKEETK